MRFVRDQLSERQRHGLGPDRLHDGDLLARRIDAQRLAGDLNHHAIAYGSPDRCGRGAVGVGIEKMASVPLRT